MAPFGRLPDQNRTGTTQDPRSNALNPAALDFLAYLHLVRWRLERAIVITVLVFSVVLDDLVTIDQVPGAHDRPTIGLAIAHGAVHLIVMNRRMVLAVVGDGAFCRHRCLDCDEDDRHKGNRARQAEVSRLPNPFILSVPRGWYP